MPYPYHPGCANGSSQALHVAGSMLVRVSKDNQDVPTTPATHFDRLPLTSSRKPATPFLLRIITTKKAPSPSAIVLQSVQRVVGNEPSFLP